MLMYADSGYGYALGPNGYADAGYSGPADVAAGGGGFGGGLVSYRDINLFSPLVQSFPSSVAEAVAAGFSANILAAWDCQDLAAQLTDFSGNGRHLVDGPGFELYAQRAVGLFTGSSFTAQKCAEFRPGGTSYFQAADAAILDFDWTTRWSVLMSFRFAEVPTSTACLYAKGTFPGSGWAAYNDGTGTGSITFQVRDSSGHVVALVTPSGNHTDGAWHWLYAQYDPIADTLTITTDVAPTTSASTAAIVSSAAAADKFRLGQWDGAGVAFRGQIRSCLVFGDVATSVATIQAWWVHANTPAGLVYTRASSLHCRIADESGGDVVASYRTGQFAFEYSPLISTNALKIGAPIDLGATNLLPNTDLNLGANWVPSGTYAIYDADSPRGFREAPKHTKTAAGSLVLCSVASGAAVNIGTTYTFSLWCRWDGTGTAPEIRVYRQDGTTLIGTTSATDNSNTMRRLSLTFSAPATETVRPAFSGAAAASTSGGAWFDMPMVNTGSLAANWIYAKAATASSVAPVLYATVSGLTSDVGAFRAWHTARVQSSPSNRIIVQCTSAIGANTNERVGYINNTTNTVNLYDTSTVTTGGAPADWATVESVSTFQWDTASRFGFRHRVARTPGNNVANDNVALSGAAGANNQYVYIGNRAAGGEQLGGIVSKVRVWRSAIAA